ncbi:hypothetical protein BS17DRAFT_160791 [Gyrodon lividus]|nr:hypothetical protein BS17DRAFT_160791 [Gyrodon lividus]
MFLYRNHRCFQSRGLKSKGTISGRMPFYLSLDPTVQPSTKTIPALVTLTDIEISGLSFPTCVVTSKHIKYLENADVASFAQLVTVINIIRRLRLLTRTLIDCTQDCLHR